MAEKWHRRAEKLRRRRSRMVEHGKAFGQMVANAVRKRSRKRRKDRNVVQYQ